MTLFTAPNELAVVPSARRSQVARRMTAAIASGQLELQVCGTCGTVQYPPRETCRRCLSDRLAWQVESGAGELLSRTVLHFSHDPYFRARTPWYVGLVRLDSGPTVLVHLAADSPRPPARIWVKGRLDRGGGGVLVASGKGDGADSMEDPRLREMCSNPKGANVLVTDARQPHSQAVVRALAAAGAARIWVGVADPAERPGVPEALRDLPQLTGLHLDVTDTTCVEAAAAAIAGEVDILINTAGLAGIARSVAGLETARSEMEVHYFGLLHLARHFGAPLSERASRARLLCPAWVNVLSVSGLPGHSPWGTYGASMAAARSLSQSLRAQLREAGVRVVNVYPGPLDDERSQEQQVPKLSATALAKAIVEGLRAGMEEVFPGEVAQEWLQANRAQQGSPARADEGML